MTIWNWVNSNYLEHDVLLEVFVDFDLSVNQEVAELLDHEQLLEYRVHVASGSQVVQTGVLAQLSVQTGYLYVPVLVVFPAPLALVDDVQEV